MQSHAARFPILVLPQVLSGAFYETGILGVRRSSFAAAPHLSQQQNRKRGTTMKMLKMSGLAVTALVMVWTNVTYGQLGRTGLLNLNRRPVLSDQSQIAKFPPLVPLLPFAEAVGKAKAGDGAGLYAVALHYAKGDEIQHDDIRARTYLKVAADAGYGNAVLMNTIVLEHMMGTNMDTNDDRQGLIRLRELGGNENLVLMPNTDKYTQGIDVNQFADSNYRGRLSERERDCNIARRIMSVANEDDVAVVRNGYEKAALLGVTAATNELARFEARLAVLELQRKIREIVNGQKQRLQKQFPMQKIIVNNEELAKGLERSITNSVLNAISQAHSLLTTDEKERTRATEERAQQRESLLQIQEQLRKQREEREAVRRVDEEREEKAKKEREKFFPPLMPFADAIKKAKDGDGAAMYSLALHYAKGDEIAKAPEKARYYLKKAADANYPAAVLIDAIEQEWEIEGVGGYVNGSNINPETGLNEMIVSGLYQVISLKRYQSKNPLKDVECIDAIRSGYKKAASLGLSVATNELARFEKRMAEIKKAADIKAKNEALAKELQ